MGEHLFVVYGSYELNCAR